MRQNFARDPDVPPPLVLTSAALRQVLDAMAESVMLIDADARIVYTNPAYQALVSLPVERLHGRRLDEVEPESLLLEVLRTGRSVRDQLYGLRAAGIECIVRAAPLQEQGRLVGAVAYLRESESLPVPARQENKGATGGEVVAASPEMRRVLAMADRVAAVDSTVLITGESGVGKEVVANRIHRQSRRARGPFVTINCGAIPEQLLESELFGYGPGAFTGAMREGKPGLLKAAERGTLFLDEVGEMPLGLQVKLLKVIQERVYTPVGSVKPLKADVRIVAATNRDLTEQVRRGLFREDLYYRLNVIPIEVPPLRNRRADIRPLAEATLARLRSRYGLERAFSAQVIEWMEQYDWPGNVRELENTVERMAILGEQPALGLAELHGAIRVGGGAMEPGGEPLPLPGAGGHLLRETLERTERELITQALRCHDSIRKAAAYLGIDHATLLRKAKRYGVTRNP